MGNMGGGHQHPEGSWLCIKCNNTNWPLRTACNRCQEPRESGESRQQQQQQQQYFTPPQLYGAMAAGPQAFAGLPMAHRGAMAAAAPTSMRGSSKGGFQHPEGSWVCASCENINWPLREACNRCKEAKPASAKLAPTTAAAPAQVQQQVQYLPAQMSGGGQMYAQQGGYGGYAAVAAPQRMAAPAYGGGQQQAAYGGRQQQAMYPTMQQQIAYNGMQQQQQQQQQQRADGNPEGSWDCECGNVNWPRRTAFNRCQKEKPAQ